MNKIKSIIILFVVLLNGVLYGATEAELIAEKNKLLNDNNNLYYNNSKLSVESNGITSIYDKENVDRIINSNKSRIERNNSKLDKINSQLEQYKYDSNSIPIIETPVGSNNQESNSGLNQSEIDERIRILERIRQDKVNNIANLIIASDNDYKTILAYEKDLEKLACNKSEKDFVRANCIKINIENLKKNIYNRQEYINKTAKEISTIYDNLAKICENSEKVGDPVDISTGSYIANYFDFEAEDYLKKFNIERVYSYDNYKGKFGYNWNSSLDMRIIRCNCHDVSKIIDKLKESIDKNKDLIDKCNSFINEYGSNSVSGYLSRAYNQKSTYESDLSYLLDLKKTSEYLQEKNKYVTYGKYENLENYYGFKDNLIFLDSQGYEHYFHYEGNGTWKELNGEFSCINEIRCLNKNGEYSFSEDCEGGYELEYKSGDIICFSTYGLVNEIIDRNKNRIEFLNNKGEIDEIILKTGEHLKIKKNDKGYITAIEGAVSGGAYYFYENDLLIKAKDNKGIAVSYIYNEKNQLIEIIKADKSSVKIGYEYNNYLKKDVCSYVTNENNCTEYFNYDLENNTIKHDFYGEGQEYYKIDSNGNTFEYSDYKKSITKLIRNERCQLKAVIKDGNKKEFSFNDKGQISSIVFNNGSKQNYLYNERNQIIESIDSDGFINKYEYDNKGNLIKTYFGDKCCGEYEYYANGLIKKVRENNISYTYKYNDFGNITEKTIEQPLLASAWYKWEYDDKNRPIRFISSLGDDYEYKYENDKEIVIGAGLEVTKIFNERRFIVKEITKELVTEKIVEKVYEYDGVGNITAIFIDNALLGQYEYFNNGILKSYTIWNNPKDIENLQSMKIEYVYDDKWNILNEYGAFCDGKKELLKEFSYSNSGNNKIVKIKEKLQPEIIQTFNSEGQIIRENIGTKNYTIYNYSKSGRILQKKDNRNNLYKYVYLKDGSYNVIFENGAGNKVVSNYDALGNLQRLSNNLGVSYNYKYDSKGNLINEQGTFSNAEYKYDEKNRIIYFCAKDVNQNVVEEYNFEFDDDLREEKVFVDNELMSYKRKDCFDRIVESNDIKGHYFYEYDWLGNCVKIEDIYGNERVMEYSPLGEVIRISYDNGEEKNIEYDLLGNIIKISNKDNIVATYEYEDDYFRENKLGAINEIFYDENREPSRLNKYDTGETKINKSNNIISTVDNYGNIYTYNFDDNGLLINEINPLGVVKNIDNENLGNESIISKNIYGKISEIKSKDYCLNYKYDKKGNVISSESQRTGTKISYKYDNFNRCIEKSGADFRFSYEYDDMSRLSKVIEHNTGQWVSFKFDSCGRICSKTYSNGCTSEYSYNENGQIEYMISKNKLGAVIHGDFIVYDNFYRISTISDEWGNVTQYKYDNRGRLVETIYPASEKKESFYLAEATECGYFINEVGRMNVSPNNNDNEYLQKLFNKVGIGKGAGINYNCEYWQEKYDYDKNGNLIKVENPFGIINYTYDKLNRIIAKNYNNTLSEGIKIKWNKDNCLEKYESKTRKVMFEYGEMKRPVKIIDENLSSGELKIKEFLYDSLGRRVIEKNNNEIVEYIYDGLSTYVLSKQYITKNNYVLQPYENDIKYNEQIKENNNSQKEYNARGEYRTVDNTKYRAFGSDEELGTEKNKSQIDNRAFNILGVGGNALLISYKDGNFSEKVEIQFPITNYSNEIIGFVNGDSNLVNAIDYDTWGNIWEEGTASTYTGAKVKDKDFTSLFNLGFRDYSPLIKTFISEDPLRDGRNWYSYCCCDPVNFEDSFGLKKEYLTDAENYKFNSYIVSYLCFNKLQYDMNAKKGENYMEICASFDCADVLGAVAYNCLKEVGIESEQMPEGLRTFGEKYVMGDIFGAKNAYSASMLTNSKETTLKIAGYDRDAIKNAEKNNISEEIVNNEKERRNNCIELLKTPGNVNPGSLLVWKTSNNKSSSAPESQYHAIPILEVHTDENGVPIGFICLEGHFGGYKTELTYISIEPKDGVYCIDDYMGNFHGVVDINVSEREKTKGGCGK